LGVRTPLILALVLGAASLATADRLITIPLGRKVPFDNFKFDTFIEMSSGRTWDRYIGFGLTHEIEIDYHGEKIDHGPMRDTFDLSYNLISPLVNQAPGISAGVQDVLNRTRNGRRVYIATTWRQAVDNVGKGNLPFETTLGVSEGHDVRPFVGVSIPLSDQVRFLTEHDGFRIATGFEYKAFKNAFSARLIYRDQDVMFGANLTLKF
jgi:hypothetical protein